MELENLLMWLQEIRADLCPELVGNSLVLSFSVFLWSR
jgi:hypothetical protein